MDSNDSADLESQDWEGILNGSDDVVDSSKLCADLVNFISRNPSAACKVGELLARFGSEESFRVQAGKNGVLSALLPFFSSPEISTRLQLLRAIGNLCIDNDENRETILSAGGCQILAEQLDRCSDPSCEEFTNNRYKCVTCGCILNLTSDNEKLSQGFLCEGTLEKISSLLSIPDQSNDVIRYGLGALSAIVEIADHNCLKSLVFLKSLLHLLNTANQKESDYMNSLLTVIKIVADKEDESLSMKLIEIGISKELLQVEHTECQQAMDILMLLLGKDECMEALFKDGEVLKVAIGWLEGTTQLRMANGALFIANLARSDSNSISLVQSGVIPLLMPLIRLTETEKMEGKLHYAALSALRNLSLPADHKKMFFSMGVLDCAIHALNTSTMSHVQFKAIGVMRLLAENQASTGAYIIMEAMERVCEVCQESGISHVHIEAGRLLSVVVKYCQDRDILLKISKEGGIKWIYHLLQQCKQPQLIAEGLIAINVIVMHLKGSNAYETFSVLKQEASSIPSCLCTILTSPFPLNLINNSLILMETLLSTDSEIRDILKKSIEIKQAVQNLISHENEEIKLKSKEVFSCL